VVSESGILVKLSVTGEKLRLLTGRANAKSHPKWVIFSEYLVLSGGPGLLSKVQGSRFTVHGSRFTGSRLTVHGSRLTVHGSRFTVHGLTAHGSRGRGSRFTVHGLTAHGSRFTGSRFTVHGSRRMYQATASAVVINEAPYRAPL
jgi:hypothetical protein